MNHMNSLKIIIWTNQSKTQQNHVHIRWDILSVYTEKWENESCHDANFVITGGTRGCQASGAISDDKVGIMMTLHFQCM